MKKIIIFLLFSITFVFASVGKITSAKGEVFVLRDSSNLQAKSGFLLELNDKVITKDKSKALLLFNDKTTITVGKNSNLSVNEFVMDYNTPSNSKAKFGFGKGVFRTITGKIGKINPKGFEIKTKSASIGIRGTIFRVAITPTNLVVDVQSGATWVLPAGESVPTDVPMGSVLVFDDEKGTLEVMTKAEFEEKKAEETQKEDTKKDDTKKDDSTGGGNDDTTPKENNPNGETPDEGTPEGTLPPTQDDEPVTTPSGEIAPLDPVESLEVETPEVETELTSNDLNSTEVSSNINVDATIDEVIDEVIDETTEVLNLNGDLVNLTNVTKDSVCTVDNYCDHYSTYMDYGFAVDSTSGELLGTYVDGVETPLSVVQLYLDSATQITADYWGAVAAINNGTQYGGYINLTMDFSAQTVDGVMGIGAAADDYMKWMVNINSASLSASGFSTTDITDAEGNNYVNGGNLEGKFYGADADRIGGKFSLDTYIGDVHGTFGAGQSGP